MKHLVENVPLKTQQALREIVEEWVMCDDDGEKWIKKFKKTCEENTIKQRDLDQDDYILVDLKEAIKATCTTSWVTEIYRQDKYGNQMECCCCLLDVDRFLDVNMLLSILEEVDRIRKDDPDFALPDEEYYRLPNGSKDPHKYPEDYKKPSRAQFRQDLGANVEWAERCEKLVGTMYEGHVPEEYFSDASRRLFTNPEQFGLESVETFEMGIIFLLMLPILVLVYFLYRRFRAPAAYTGTSEPELHHRGSIIPRHHRRGSQDYVIDIKALEVGDRIRY